MNGPIRHLAAVVFTAFAVMVGAVTYLQVIQGPEYRDDPRNIRVATGLAGRERGTIITADGVMVASSSTDPARSSALRIFFSPLGVIPSSLQPFAYITDCIALMVPEAPTQSTHPMRR